MQGPVRSVAPAIVLTVLFGGLAVPAKGEPIAIFTFEQFTPPPQDVGPRTPLVNVVPDVGMRTLRATFTASPETDLFGITRFNRPLSVFSGNVLFGRHGSPVGESQSLTVTFNEVLKSVTFPFAAQAFEGTLLFSSPSGSTAVTARRTGNPDDFFTAGTLSFASANPFNTFTLTMFSGSFALDTLRLEIADAPPVPEPATLVLMGSALSTAVCTNRRRRTP